MRKEDKYPLLCLLIFIAVFIVCAINPWYPRDWFLESILSLIAVPVLVLTYRKFRFSNTSYTLILLFMTLQAIGSHFTYAEVPIDFISNILGFTRNNYDRFVHLMFGVLWYLPILEVYKKITKAKDCFFTFLMPAAIIVSLGAIFEVIEWLAAIIVEPELGIAYLGTQGDQWDTQKDLMLKVVSSFFMTLLFTFRKKN